jgi:GntR family transcriptional regulator, sialic acid-inducible nan operon repressor
MCYGSVSGRKGFIQGERLEPDGKSALPHAERLGDVVCDELARMIMAGEIVEGERLPTERDLMRRFGVSRTAVREAIDSLSHRGLANKKFGHRPVARKPNYEAAIDRLGNFISHLVADRQGMPELFESRVFVEAGLVRWAAQHARQRDLDNLKQALEANRAAIGNWSDFYATDIAFHAVLYRIPGNAIYPAVHKAYVEWLVQLWRSMRTSAELDRMNYAGHLSIFEAISARDPDRAEDALRRHLAAAWELIRSAVLADSAG